MLAIVGGGAVGSTAALLAAKAGYRPVLFSRDLSQQPSRTVALFLPAIAILEQAGLWEALKRKAWPLKGLRLIDSTSTLMRAPTLYFNCTAYDVPAFGYNMAIDDFHEVSTKALSAANVETLYEKIVGCDVSAAPQVTLHGEQKDYEVEAVAAADGRRSFLRQAAGISVKESPGTQQALVALVEHEGDHRDISNEFHTAEGPCTLVPFGPRRSSLVWLMRHENAQHFLTCADHVFCAALKEITHAIVGEFSLCSQRAQLNVETLAVDCYARHRIFLLGEAGHVFSPIGAQGLNLGLRDAANFVDLYAEFSTNAAACMQRYNRERKHDTSLRAAGISALNNSLLSPRAPIHYARGLGLYLMQSLPALREKMVRMGLGS